MAQDIIIRRATSADSDTIRDIYGEYMDTPITFETELPSKEEFQARTDGIMEFFPYLVAEENGQVIGYAYAHKQAERAAYRWNSELSIYLSHKAKGKGLGTALYTALIDLIKLQGILNAYALITVPNEASFHLHEKMGFKLEWIQPRAGWKGGKWYDVAWYILQIGPCEGNPAELVAFDQLPAEQVDAVLAKVNATLV